MTLTLPAPKWLICGTRELFRQAVLAAVVPAVTEVVIDFTVCEYVDSSGIGVLLVLRKTLGQRGVSLALRNVREDFRAAYKPYSLPATFAPAPPPTRLQELRAELQRINAEIARLLPQPPPAPPIAQEELDSYRAVYGNVPGWLLDLARANKRTTGATPNE